MSYYMVDSTGLAKGQISVPYGYGVDATKGRAFVVHDRKGVRIACGLLPATTDSVPLGRFARYPDYAGPLQNVTGHIKMDFRGTSVAIGYDLSGVDPRCTAPNNTVNPLSCGLHIHMGMTCSNATDIGGHYWNDTYKPASRPNATDPWPMASYVSTDKGTAEGHLGVDYGYGFSTSAGRSVVLHDYDGGRISCVQIPMMAQRVTTPLPALAPYPGYIGPQIGGSVQVDFRGAGVKILYNLTGTDPMCTGVPGDAPNSCGIHIHSGLCDNAGGHYFDATMYKMDPWTVAVYKSQLTPSSLIVSYGFDFDHTKHRSVVIHSYNGTRVACTTVKTAMAAPTQSDAAGLAPGLVLASLFLLF